MLLLLYYDTNICRHYAITAILRNTTMRSGELRALYGAASALPLALQFSMPGSAGRPGAARTAALRLARALKVPLSIAALLVPLVIEASVRAYSSIL